MDVDVPSTEPAAATSPSTTPAAPGTAPTAAPPAPVVSDEPEVAAFLGLLVLITLVDARKLSAAQNLSATLIDSLAQWNRRTLDPLSGRLFFFFARAHELDKKSGDIRVRLLQLLRTA